MFLESGTIWTKAGDIESNYFGQSGSVDYDVTNKNEWMSKNAGLNPTGTSTGI